MTATPQEIYERYLWAGAITRNADALADLFTADGVWEAPLAPADATLPRRLEGREQIRTEMAAYHQRLAGTGDTADAGSSRYTLHVTTDPSVFIAEVDAVVNRAGEPRTISLVQIFRIAPGGKIALVRDYFGPELMA
jgi:ketosteroid isomerase-like protein